MQLKKEYNKLRQSNTLRPHKYKQVCAAEMAVRYAALCACRKVRVIVIR